VAVAGNTATINLKVVSVNAENNIIIASVKPFTIPIEICFKQRDRAFLVNQPLQFVV
jgi:hypothetical protein